MQINAPGSLSPEISDSTPAASHPAGGWRRAVAAIWPWLAAIASGLLLSLCYPGFDQGWLVWIALTPFICAVWFSGKTGSASRWKRAWRPFLLGYVSGLLFFAITFRWLGELAPLFHTPWLRGLSILLALYMALYPALWAVLIARLPRGSQPFQSSPRNLGIGALAATIWTALEWTRGWLFSGFGWNGLGAALHKDLAMIQIADLTGVLGVTWLVAFVNVMAVVVVRRIVDEFGPIFLKKVRWEFSFTMALMAGVFAYGVRALFLPPPNATPLRVAAIQPNIPQQEKFDPDAEDRILGELRKLNSLAALLSPQPDLVVWPEAATPRGMFADPINHRFVMEEAARGDFSLLLGTLDYDWTPLPPPSQDQRPLFQRLRDGVIRGLTWPPDPRTEGARHYNAAMLLSEQGNVRSVYRKMHLVPFGEYLPWRAALPNSIAELVPGDLDPGAEVTTMPLAKPAVDLGVLICFEDTLGDLTRRFVKNGAEVLVNVTNDGWFGRSVAAEQHLANAVFRAVENRRPLLRCANTGVTCSIDTGGRVNRGGLRNFEQGFTPFEIAVPRTDATTFYTRHGDWLGWLSAGVTALYCGIAAWRRNRRSPRG